MKNAAIDAKPRPVPKLRSRHHLVALCLVGVVAGMVGLSYAAVPLYRIFCQVTGYGGTTQRAEKASEVILDRIVQIRFDANVSKEVPWQFKPVQRTIDVKIGENTLAFYHAKNLSDREVRGTATFNVTPEAAGYYFNKIDCFCFTEQVLAGGEEVDMPLTFFVDPEIVNDPDAKKINQITLSYTFFPLKDEADGNGNKKPSAASGNKGT